MKPNIIVVNSKDNVAIALADIKKGETGVLKDGRTFVAESDIPFSHKLLLEDLPQGADIVKYGEIIGQVNQDVKQGEWVHTHNLGTREDEANENV